MGMLALSLTISTVHAALASTHLISTHHYQGQASSGELKYTFCGYTPAEMDLSRVTAVQDLVAAQCGTCLEVTANARAEYVMAVDRGGAGLDLNTASFHALFNDTTGRYRATWRPADPARCQGVFRGDPTRAPGASNGTSKLMPSAGEVGVQSLNITRQHPPKPSIVDSDPFVITSSYRALSNLYRHLIGS